MKITFMQFSMRSANRSRKDSARLYVSFDRSIAASIMIVTF